MYLIYRTKTFEKSYSRLKRSGINGKVVTEIENVIDLLSSGEPIDSVFRDHKLNGEYEGYRECHIRTDLLLIYRLQEDKIVLALIDIGSHSYLFE